MLLYHLYYVEYLCIGTLIISALVAVSAVYAYSVNSRRPDDDPKKKDFPPAAIFLAAFTWPFFIPLFLLLLISRIIIFVLKAILYGLFLILFTLALIGIRKPFLFMLLDKILTSMGNALLEASTLLIRFFFRPWTNEPETI